MQKQGRPHDTIPNTYAEAGYDSPPPGYTVGYAKFSELQAAGFHEGESVERKPGTMPTAELTAGVHQIESDVAAAILAESTFRVLRDPAGTIVASWDEGRWWTPDESDAFTQALIQEMG